MNSPSKCVACFTTNIRCGGNVWRVLSTGVCIFFSMTGNLLPEAEVLQKIRLLFLTGRDTQFLELRKHKEALLDFQCSLQVSPGERLFWGEEQKGFSLFFPPDCFAISSRKIS